MRTSHSARVSYSFTADSRRHQHDVAAAAGYSPPFTTWNVLLYICLLNPLICLFNVCLTLKYVVLYMCSPPALRSIHQRLTIHDDDDIEVQAEKRAAAAVGTKTAVITDLLSLLAVHHLQNIRVRMVTDDGPIDQQEFEQPIEDIDPSKDRPKSSSRLSQSARSSVMTCGTNDDQACLRPPEPAHHDPSLPVSVQCTPLKNVAKDPEFESPHTSPTPKFALSRLLVMHLLAAPVSIVLVFAGYVTALACLYSMCLGESINEDDSAGLWRTWGRCVVWPVQNAAHLQLVPVKHCC
ncbi:hypothetical protein V1509DRAFT_641651 [Lipomyces kononenkoae]